MPEKAVRRGTVKLDTARFATPELLSELVHKIGHEIGNPLTSIISLGTIIERFSASQNESSSMPGLEPEKVASYAGSIIDEAWRITSITEKMVLLLSDRRGNQGPVELGMLVQRAVGKLKTRRLGDSDYILLQLAAGPLEVNVDGDHLLVLISELLSNAFTASVGEGTRRDEDGDEEEEDFNPASSYEPPIRIELLPEGSDILLRVSNRTKEAIGVDDLSQLFNPLVTAHPGGRHVGVGLTVAAILVHKNGGSIELTEEPLAEGYRFAVEVRFPSTKAVAKAPETAADDEALPATLRVIVAEDESTVASAIAKILHSIFSHKTQFSCRCVSGEEAIAAIEGGEPFEAMLCDLNLAGMSGRHVLDTLLNERPDEVHKFAFLTGDRMRRETQLYLQTTNCPYLHKPFEPHELAELIYRLVKPR